MFKGTAENLCIDHIDRNKTNNRPENLRGVSKAVNSRNCKLWETNSSGIVGVSKSTKGGVLKAWRARWVDLEGRQQQKSFSVLVTDPETAFISACNYRIKMIQELNILGAGYTQSHGVKTLPKTNLASSYDDSQVLAETCLVHGSVTETHQPLQHNHH